MNTVLSYIALVASWCVSFYTFVLVARMVLDWIQYFSPDWRPGRALILVANIVYALTDPPLRLLRRVIPPLNLGEIAIDVGFVVLFFGVVLAGRLVSALI